MTAAARVELVEPWIANALGLTICLVILTLWALALLWRLGSWHIAPAASLTYDEGLRIGATAPEIACHGPDGEDYHLSFGDGQPTFVAFGSAGCRPCEQLLAGAYRHPALRHVRKVYVSDQADPEVPPAVIADWETYAFADEDAARDMWRAPVSPYFHLLDAAGRVIDKGVANSSRHLDRLLAVRPGESALQRAPELV